MLTIGGKDLQKRFAGTDNVDDVYLGSDHIWPGTKYYAVNAIAQYVTLNGQTITNPNANWKENYYMFVFEVNNGDSSYPAIASADDVSGGSEIQVVNCLDPYNVAEELQFGSYKTQGAVGILSRTANYTYESSTINVIGYTNRSIAESNAVNTQVTENASDVVESVLEHEIEIIHVYNNGGSGTDWISINKLNATVHGLPIYQMNVAENTNDRTQGYGGRRCKIKVYQKDNPANYKEIDILQESKFGTSLATSLVLTKSNNDLIVNGELTGENRTDREVISLDCGDLSVWYYNTKFKEVMARTAKFVQDSPATKCHFDLSSVVEDNSEVMGLAFSRVVPSYKTSLDPDGVSSPIASLTVNWFDN